MNGLITGVLLCCALTLLLLPYYCKITFYGKTSKTLILKMFQSLLFLLTAVFAVVASDNFYPFAFIMLGGFCLSAVGDFFLGKSEGSKVFLIGAAFFASAHVAYITAFSLASRSFFPRVGWFNVIEIFVYIALICSLALLCMARKPRFHKLFLPMCIYFCVLCLMVTKAFGLGFRLAVAGSEPAVLLPIGAILFLSSDTTLGMMRFKMAKRTFTLRSYCSCSYFIGQLLMAVSILFIK